MKRMIIALIALMLLFTGCAYAQELKPAPDFTVYDSEGKAVKLTEFIGKSVVLNFWASWCPPCKAEMPEFQTVFDEYGENVAFMMLNSTDGSRETVEKAQAYIAENAFAFPVYFDKTMEAGYALNIYALPTTIFIDAEGRIVDTIVGMTSAEKLREKLTAMNVTTNAAP